MTSLQHVSLQKVKFEVANEIWLIAPQFLLHQQQIDSANDQIPEKEKPSYTKHYTKNNPKVANKKYFSIM